MFSLPRSRSAWLSHFLSYDGRLIGHDTGIECGSVPEFMALIGDGTCETGAAFAWRLVRDLAPETRLAVVARPVDEVVASLERLGFSDIRGEIEARAEHLAELSAQPGVATVSFDDLRTAEGCAAIFNHCLGEPMPIDHWHRLSRVNIQVDLPRRLHRLAENRTRIEALKADARERLRHVAV